MENDDEKIPYFGLWADLRKNYLKAEKPAEYEKLASENLLIEYLESVNDRYRDRFNDMVERQMEREGVDEELKSKNPLEWVGRVNNIRSQVKEILTSEICS